MGDGGNPKTLLCVDDESTGLSVRKAVLESQGYCVLTAENGRDALRVFTREAVDLVVLDYFMPGMHGGVVARRMKDLKPSVPILMLSAYVDLPLETLVVVDRSLTKGDLPEALIEAIAGLLCRGHAVPAATGS